MVVISRDRPNNVLIDVHISKNKKKINEFTNSQCVRFKYLPFHSFKIYIWVSHHSDHKLTSILNIQVIYQTNLNNLNLL